MSTIQILEAQRAATIARAPSGQGRRQFTHHRARGARQFTPKQRPHARKAPVGQLKLVEAEHQAEMAKLRVQLEKAARGQAELQVKDAQVAQLSQQLAQSHAQMRQESAQMTQLSQQLAQKDAQLEKLRQEAEEAAEEAPTGLDSIQALLEVCRARTEPSVVDESWLKQSREAASELLANELDRYARDDINLERELEGRLLQLQFGRAAQSDPVGAAQDQVLFWRSKINEHAFRRLQSETFSTRLNVLEQRLRTAQERLREKESEKELVSRIKELERRVDHSQAAFIALEEI